MKDKMKLSKLLAVLPEETREAIAAVYPDEGDVTAFRKSRAGIESLEEGERAAIRYVSTRDIDRDGEILLPSGVVLDQFKLAPQVLWGHNYSMLPIGSDEWIKADDYGVKAKTIYAEHSFAEDVWNLVRKNHLQTSSVGFVPMEWSTPEDASWKPLTDGLKAAWGVKSNHFKDVRRIYTKWLLLEHSDVPVPSNIHALTVAVSKGLQISDDLRRELQIDDIPVEEEKFEEKAVEVEVAKGVIPFRDLGIAEEGMAWDGTAQIREADTATLKLICAWYDTENPDVKGSYKLPHHLAGGEHPAVWRGVTAAMVALLGGRGGVDIPESDKQAVYKHLVKHYQQFEKEPPEMRMAGRIIPVRNIGRIEPIRTRPLDVQRIVADEVAKQRGKL